MNNTVTHSTAIETLALELTREEGVLGARIIAPMNPELWSICPGWRIEIKVTPNEWPQFDNPLIDRNGFNYLDENHADWYHYVRERVERTEASLVGLPTSLGYSNPIEWDIVTEYPFVRAVHTLITEMKVYPVIPTVYDLPRILQWAELSQEYWDVMPEHEQEELLGDYLGTYETEVIRYD